MDGDIWCLEMFVFFFFIIKGVVFILFYILVDYGYFCYDDLVSKYWLEFGQKLK